MIAFAAQQLYASDSHLKFTSKELRNRLLITTLRFFAKPFSWMFQDFLHIFLEAFWASAAA